MKQNHNVNGTHQLPLLSSHHPLNALSHHTLTTASGLTFYQISTIEQVTKLRESDQFRRTLSSDGLRHGMTILSVLSIFLGGYIIAILTRRKTTPRHRLIGIRQGS